jgi:hypothetical protein
MAKCVKRMGSFETNSSSMHSICIMKNTPEKDLPWNDIYVEGDGTWDLSDTYGDKLYFGRYPFQILTTPGQKAKYAIANMVEESGDEAYEEILSALQTIEPNLKRISFVIRTGVEYDKATPENIEKCKKWHNECSAYKDRIVYWDEDTGSVDDYLLEPFLKKYNISLSQFILERNIIVVCDGDEYCQWTEAKNVGVIDTENILIEFPDRNKEGWRKEIEG